MKKILAIVLSMILCISCFVGCSANKGEMTLNNGYTTENLSLYEVPEWFRDAKFGIFIHYGVYSVPAYGDEWYGHQMYKKGSLTYGGDNIYDYHLKTYGGAAKFGYKDFIPSFNKEIKKFDENNMANEWANLFEQAGAKYVMPVGIHHDSFALYDSSIQKTYNSVNQAGIDYIAQLQKACKDKDIKFGISNHFVENDWFFDDEAGVGTDLAEKNADGSLVYGELYGDGEAKSEAHIHKWFDISMEIINKYHPDMIYYDFDLGNDALNLYDDANRYLMLANYYNQGLKNNPDGVVCCNKYGAFTQAEALLDKERSSLSEIASTPWQTDTSIGKKSWGYVTNEEYRTGDQFIGALVDIVSKNGNLLLNVGPKADGTIPKEAKDTLVTIGNWLSKYGDAIYATRPWIVSGEGETNATDDSFTYKEGDIRFTKSKDNSKLYVTSLTSISSDKLSVKTLNKNDWDASQIDSVSLINGSERTKLDWSQTENALEIDVPDNMKNEPFSLEITFKNGEIPTLATFAGVNTRAENAFEMNNVQNGHSIIDGSTTVVANDNASIKQRISFADFDPAIINLEVGKNAGEINIFNDDTNEQIASVKFKKSDDTYRTVSAPVENLSINQKINLRIEMKSGTELASYKFNKKKVAFETIDAAEFDGKQGNVQAEPTADVGGGNSLGYVGAGDFVVYKNVEFQSNATKLTLRAGADNRTYRVYLDSMKKKNIIAEGTISTGGYNNYEDVVVDVKASAGTHDVYIEFVDDAINLNWFVFE